MTANSSAWPILLACCVLLSAAATAQSRPEKEDEGDDTKTWAEIEIKLPPYPRPESLLEFQPSAASSNRFFVDASSISVDSDGVVRYALVIRSPSGAENVSYEGIRCETVEQRYYAFGRRDGTWAAVRAGTWRRIEYKEVNRQHGVLYSSYFCPDGKEIRSSKDAINRFKYGVPYGQPPRSGSK